MVIVREISVPNQRKGQSLAELNIKREGEDLLYAEVYQWIKRIPELS